MKKIKYPVKKKRTDYTDLSKFSFDSNYRPNRILKILIYFLAFAIPVVLTYMYLRHAFRINKDFGFPLDDPWIHLTFAKNLFQYLSFSFFKDQMVTAGSTSPLYTIILSIGFFFSNNEMAISYILGILFFALACVFFYKLNLLEFSNEVIFSILCTGIFIIDSWMNFIAVSGMETTMFILILLLCSYFYKTRKAVPFAIMLGLIIWTRPDGIVFIIAVIIDYIVINTVVSDNSKIKFFTSSELKKIGIYFVAITALYFVMNFALSGTLLPNTYNAKLTYYSPEFRSRMAFLEYEVWQYFRTGGYYLIMYGFLFSILVLIYDLVKRNYNGNLPYILFVLGLVFIYWLKLPYAHRFGRYLMPVIPFFILVSVIGFRDFARLINRYTANVLFSKCIFFILIGIVYFMAIKSFEDNKDLYAEQCRYITDRQVKAAKWLKDNTDPNAVIATHDIGAIGYYSGRKIVDVAGLVTPELINRINDSNYIPFMTEFLKQKGVTHLAFLKEWFRVANQNPLYSTAATLPPEVMEIYKFDPGKTYILSREANSLLMATDQLIGPKNSQQLMQIVNRVIALEPRCAEAYYLRAYANYLQKDNVNYEKNMLKAIELFPEYQVAHFYLGEHYRSLKKFQEAKEQYEIVLQLDPKNIQALNSLKLVSDSTKAN